MKTTKPTIHEILISIQDKVINRASLSKDDEILLNIFFAYGLSEAKKQLERKETFYLSFVNDFLTIERFANYYNFSVKKAEEIIKIGRIVNNYVI